MGKECAGSFWIKPKIIAFFTGIPYNGNGNGTSSKGAVHKKGKGVNLC